MGFENIENIARDRNRLMINDYITDAYWMALTERALKYISCMHVKNPKSFTRINTGYDLYNIAHDMAVAINNSIDMDSIFNIVASNYGIDVDNKY